MDTLKGSWVNIDNKEDKPRDRQPFHAPLLTPKSWCLPCVHVQEFCCNGSTQLCSAELLSILHWYWWQKLSSSASGHCLFAKQVCEGVLGFAACFVYLYLTACLVSAALYNIWILYAQWITCSFCPVLSALEQQVLLVKQLLFCGSTKSGMQVTNRWKKIISVTQNHSFPIPILGLEFPSWNYHIDWKCLVIPTES